MVNDCGFNIRLVKGYRYEIMLGTWSVGEAKHVQIELLPVPR